MHNNKNKNEYIYNLDTFYKKYNYYDKKIFVSLNQDTIQKYENIYSDLLYDFDKNELKDDLLYMKLFVLFSTNGISITNNILIFLKNNPNINLKNIVLLNKKNLDLNENNLSLEDKNIIYFYQQNLHNKNIILNISDFEKNKTFNLEIFKKFNKKYENLDKIYCISKYLNENLIGSIYDFLNKYPDYDIKNINQNYNKEQIIDILVSYNLKNRNKKIYKLQENTINIKELKNEILDKNIEIKKEVNKNEETINEETINEETINEVNKNEETLKEETLNEVNKNEEILNEEKINNELNILNEHLSFDWLFYTSNYGDLSFMNKQQALEHYLKYGIKEKKNT